MDYLVRTFGEERFTVADCFGGYFQSPPSQPQTANWLRALEANGRLLSCPGPRGGVGYQISKSEIEKSLRRRAKEDKAQAERMRKHAEKQVRIRDKQIMAAVELLTNCGYTVSKLQKEKT